MQMSEVDKKLVLTIKREPDWVVLLFTGIWLLIWLGITGTIIFGLVTDPDMFDDGIMLFMTIFFLGGLFFLKIFLWHLRGKEIITIDDKELRIDKVGTILSFPSIFEIDQIDYISNTEKPMTPKWIKFWGLGGGQIEFVFLGQTKYFGQTLSVSEATKVIEQIKEKMKTTTR